MDNVTVSESAQVSPKSATIKIKPYAATHKNAGVVCNLLLAELLDRVRGVDKAIGQGQEDSVRHPDFVWPDDEENAWYCDTAIQVIIRDLESIQSRAITVDDLGYRFFQVESTLKLIKFAAPKSAAYVGRCLDGAIKLAYVCGSLATDSLKMEGAAV